MKKYVSILLIIAVCVSFCACAKNNETDPAETEPTSKLAETTVLPEVKTTAEPKNDEQNGTNLKKAVIDALNIENDEISGNTQQGSFTVKLNKLDAAKMYGTEYNEKNEAKAKKNSAKLVKSIAKFYPDGKKIEQLYFDAQEIGSGENGLDTVNYSIVYINSQNQTLTIRADSTGDIYYAECNFTW